MNETELQEAIIDAAHTFGWLVAHFRPARTKDGWRTPVAADGKGFPDLILLHPAGAQLVRELKGAGGTASPEQLVWLDLFTRAGVDTGIWTPADWPDRVIAELRAGRELRRQT